jgi:hypothetical protein
MRPAANCTYGIGSDVFKFSVKVSEDCTVSTANRRSLK